jgi:GDP-L-fucose synthase
LKTLVTGSEGLLGTAIKKFSGENFYFAKRDDADLRDFEQTSKLFAHVKPKRVIHLAAKVGGVEANTNYPGTFFYENLSVNMNVLKNAQLFGVEKLVSFISTCAFPNESQYPLSSENLQDGEPHQSNNGYAYAKRMLEIQSRVFRKEFGCNFITLIPTNMYGPADNWSTSSGHVIPSLIHKTYLAKKYEEPLTVWGTGLPLREFIFSEDVAKLTLWAIESYESSQPLILSNSIETSIKELVETIARRMCFEGDILWDASKPEGQFQKPSNSQPLKELLPNFNFTSLEKGLGTTIEWFQQNYDNLIRK